MWDKVLTCLPGILLFDLRWSIAHVICTTRCSTFLFVVHVEDLCFFFFFLANIDMLLYLCEWHRVVALFRTHQARGGWGSCDALQLSPDAGWPAIIPGASLWPGGEDTDKTPSNTASRGFHTCVLLHDARMYCLTCRWGKPTIHIRGGWYTRHTLPCSLRCWKRIVQLQHTLSLRVFSLACHMGTP